jgi:hypothetical protein
MTPKRNVFLDTSIILEGGMQFLSRVSKVANLYVTDIVLQELDGKKNAEGKVGYNAREFYRQFGMAKVEELHELPDGQKLDRRDVLQQMTLPDGLVLHTIHRTPYKTKDINDSKIIEVAKDYKGTLSTIDMAQSVRAKSVGCEAWVVERGGGVENNGGMTDVVRLIVLSSSFFGVGFLTIFKHQDFVLLGYGLVFIGAWILFKGWNLEFTKNNSTSSSDDSFGPHSSMDESCPVTGTDFIGTSSSSYFRD